MIDKDFLQGCTKEQINKGVVWLESKKSNVNVAWCGWNFKPCTNPNDIMPIAFANEIGLDCIFHGKKWIALAPTWSTSSIESTNENPLRAICEVYLLMSNEK